MTINTVVFDVGETLIDETRFAAMWADFFGVPRHTYSALCGRAIANGQEMRDVFELLRPGIDIAAAYAEFDRLRPAQPYFLESDLYLDARPCLASLREHGLRVAIAANQPTEALDGVKGLDLPVDFIGISQVWGLYKPHAAFFERVAAEAGVPPEEIAYVGDRVDNDVAPALAAGMTAVHVRRGPHGYLQEPDPRAIRVNSLAEIPAFIGQP